MKSRFQTSVVALAAASLLFCLVLPVSAQKIIRDKRWYNKAPSSGYLKRKAAWRAALRKPLVWEFVSLTSGGHAKSDREPKSAFERRYSVAKFSDNNGYLHWKRYLVRNNETGEVIGEFGNKLVSWYTAFRGRVKSHRGGNWGDGALTEIISAQRGYRKAVRQRQDKKGALMVLWHDRMQDRRTAGYVKLLKGGKAKLSRVSWQGDVVEKVELLPSTHRLPASRRQPKGSFGSGGFRFASDNTVPIQTLTVKPGETVALVGEIPKIGKRPMANLARWTGLTTAGVTFDRYDRPIQLVKVPEVKRGRSWDVVVKRRSRYQAIRLAVRDRDGMQQANIGSPVVASKDHLEHTGYLKQVDGGKVAFRPIKAGEIRTAELLKSTHGMPTFNRRPKVERLGRWVLFADDNAVPIQTIKVRPGETVAIAGAIATDNKKPLASFSSPSGLAAVGVTRNAHDGRTQLVKMPLSSGRQWDVVVERGGRYQAIRFAVE